MKKVSLLILVSLVLIVLASCQVLPQPVKNALGIHEHEWTDATCESPKTCECGETEGEALGHTWTAATCTAPKTCSVCQATEGEALGHDYAKANCTDPATCKNCGATTGKALGHSWLDATCTDPKTCEDCGAIEGNALGHTPAAAVRENEVAPGCETDGKYDSVIYCSACKAEISREKDVIDPATGHKAGTPVKQNENAPTCTAAGSYDEVTYCTVEGCGAEVSRVTKTVEATGHKPGQAVHENGTEPDCINGGAYDEVYYCTVCSVEVSRTPVTTDPLGHDMAPATCITLSTCTVCGYTEGDFADHTPAAEVKENEVAPKCEVAGSYDIVVYCSVEGCGHEISRETKTLDPLVHDMAPATCDAPSTCKNGCGKTEGEAVAQHTPKATFANGQVTYKCATCDDTFTSTAIKIYDGANTDWQFLQNNGATASTVNKEYYEIKAAGETKAQYMLYAPGKSLTASDVDFANANNSFGVVSFRMKANTATEAIRIIIMSARENNPAIPTWDWTNDSIDVLGVAPNGDGTYRIHGQGGLTTNDFATVNADEWFTVEMFIHMTDDNMLTIGYYINGEFINVYTKDLANPGEGKATLRTFAMECIYITGYTDAGTGFYLDDLTFAVAQNQTEWLFNEHKHTWKDADCETAKHCTACGLVEGEALGHTEATRDENVVAPTCTTDGHHDAVTYCSVCNKELGRENVTDAALGHTDELVPGKTATCIDTGLTDGYKCKVCGVTTTEQTVIPALGHKNEDGDTLCDVCGTDLECQHTGETEVVPGYDADCTTPGLTDGVKCKVCNDWVTEPETIDPKGHTEATRRENEVAPTCTADGKYDLVTYCSVCNAEISRQVEVVDPKLGHDEVANAGQAATCTEKGWKDYVTCSRCDYTTYEEIAALGHSYNVATCVAGQTCSVCGAAGSGPNANAHTIAQTYQGGKLYYACQNCDYRFDVDSFDYLDGSSYNGMHVNADNNKIYYTANPDSEAQRYPVYVQDGDNTYYEYVRKTDVEGAANTTRAQLQIWLPTANAGSNKFVGFTAANKGIGYLSFKLNAYTDSNLEFKLVGNITDNLDLDGDGTAESVRWAKEWAISSPVFSVSPVNNGKVELKGFESVLKTVTVDENNYTGWFDVAIQIVLDEKTDKVIAYYYIDGAYAGTREVELTIHYNGIQSVYINSNNTAAGTGYKIDNLTFGYTAHKHDMTTTVVNGVVTYACDCGTTFKLADEYREWNGDGSDSTSLGNHPNGNVTMEVVDGQYEVMFKPATTERPSFDATNDVGYETQDGWCEYDKKGYAGGQIQLWAPYSTNAGELEEFSCENNSVGVIAFSMKTSVARHPDFDTSLTLSIGKERSDPNWNNGGSWTDDSINIFTVEEYQASGVVLKGGLNGTNLNLTTIPVADGWSEWFDVMIVIEMKDNGYIYVYYYVNGAFLGSDSRDLNNPGDYRTLNPKMIEAFQLSGWTYEANTGIVFDDFYFGHTKNGHNTLDGKSHIIPADATCAAHATCSCGWTGLLVDHDLTAATCAAPATCKACGQTYGNALPHSNITSTSADGKPVYSCADCNAKFVVDSQYLYYDGSDTSVLNAHYVGGSSSFNSGVNKYVSQDGVFVGISDQTVDSAGNGQLQMWIPHTKDQTANGLTFTDFTLANASVGAFSFRVNLKFSHKSDIYVMKLVDNAWGAAGCIDVNVFAFAPIMSGDTVTGYKLSGYGPNSGDTDTQQLATFDKGEDGWSGWIDVKVILAMNPTTGNLEAYYYVNGEYVTMGEKKVTTTNQRISCVYFNANIFTAGDGFKIDDIAFGHTIGGHNIFDGQGHYYTKVAENCGEKSTCVCGWEGYTVAHTYAADCQTNCSVCNAVRANTAPHANLTPAVNGETVTYTCADCNYAYTLDGGMHDTADVTDVTTKANVEVDGVATQVATYNKTISDGYIEYENIHTAAAQWQFWVPGQTESAELAGFTNANNATGFLSFRLNVKNTDSRGTEFKVNANRGQSDWETSSGAGDGWSKSSVGIFRIKPTASGATTVALTGYNGADLGSIAITGEDGWTGWMDVVIKIQLNTNNTVSIDYYINGAYYKTITANMVIWTYEINSLYASAYTNPGEGVKIENFYFGYTLNGMSKVEAPEAPFYKEVIAAENVTNEALKTINAGKIKQFDQANANADPVANGDYFVEGGTPVYVIADKNGTDVEALYFSRSVEWLTGSQNSGWSEFRFNVTGKVTKISVDYKVNGTVDSSTEESDDGIGALGTSYVQIKTSAGAYVDLANSSLTIDGEWHTITLELGEGVEITNILVKLYHFQGEMLIANPQVTMAAAPLYNEVIAAENVTNAALTTILANKIKQVDQVNADSTRSEADATAASDWYSSTNGTAVYVTTNVNGKDTEGVYFSRSKDWFNASRAGEEYGFSSFRFALNANVKSITFSYRIDGTLEDCTYLGFNDKTSLLNDGSFTLTGNAYLEIVSNEEADKGTYYVVDHGTTFETDGQWHTMTIDLGEGMEMTNFLFSLYHFKGEMVVADLNVVYA